MQELEYKLIKNGGASLIFINGFRMPYRSWDIVSDSLSSKYSVLCYNRKGVGKSSKAETIQSGQEIVAQLTQLISDVGLTPPYVLIAHSLGGIYAEIFARQRPNDIAAMVLVDSAHPQEALSNHSQQTKSAFTFNHISRFVSTLFNKYKFSEIEAVEETVTYLESLGPFPQMPVSIITGGKKMPFVTQASHELHLKFQEKYLELNNLAQLHVLKNSHHFPQISEPQAVADIILRTLSYIEK